MIPGDRITVMSGKYRLHDGEFVGFDERGKPRVWFPSLNETATFEWDQLGELNPRRRRDARSR